MILKLRYIRAATMATLQEQKVEVVIEGEFGVIGGLEETITFALKAYGWTKEAEKRFQEKTA